MSKIRVWTRQNKKILKDLEEKGRYIADHNYIRADMEDTSAVMIPVYDWLTAHSPRCGIKPDDVSYMVWVSFKREATMLPDSNNVILELELDTDIITYININKWGTILNYAYIPVDEEDKIRHQKILELYGTCDVKAYMTQLYPDIKREIVESWNRLFDTEVSMGSDSSYGTIWEVKKEWVKQVIQ